MVPDILTEERPSFPFTAIVGMETAKIALLCTEVCPTLRSVLILGPSGLGKSVVARSMAQVPGGRPLLELPPSCSPEQVFGGLDMEQSLCQGRACFLPGILMRADGMTLHTDDVGIIDRDILLGVLEAAAGSENIVEREGVSFRHHCDFVLIGGMSPSEAPLDPHLLDRFDMCAVVDVILDARERAEVVRRRILFERDPIAFRDLYEDQERELAMRVLAAKERFPYTSISDALLQVIAELCGQVGVQGHRGDIAMANACKAIAALAGRDEVQRPDLQTAAVLCLRHRQPPPFEPREGAAEDRHERSGTEAAGSGDGHERNGAAQKDGLAPPLPAEDAEPRPDVVFSIGEAFEIVDFLKDWSPRQKGSQSGHGRRNKVASLDSTGRYARAKFADGRAKDIALDASMRAAAPYQQRRDRRGLAIALEPCDLREKVRERGRGTTGSSAWSLSSRPPDRKRWITWRRAASIWRRTGSQRTPGPSSPPSTRAR